MRDRAKRALILGQGVVDGFRLDPFRAVIAHEYGHFLHRDTAGGDVALRVNATIGRFAVAMLERGHATWWNIRWQFVRLYHLLFRRITHGASRLQEIHADRVAARAFGKEAFEEGLKHVIRRDIALRYQQAVAREEFTGDDAAKPSPDLRSKFWYLRAEVRRQVENDVAQLWNAKTSEDDTHPCPADRIRLIGRLATASALPGGGDGGNGQGGRDRVSDNHPTGDGAVEDLFADPARLRAERADYLAKEVKDHAAAKTAYCTDLVAQIDAYLKEHPGLCDPVRERGNARFELNDYEGAIRDYTEAIRLDGPNPALSYFGRGLARTKLGDLAAAAADLRKAMALDSSLEQEKANGRAELGEILLRLGDFAAAIAEYDRAIELDPNDLGFKLRRGEAFATAGDTTRADADFTRALELDPRCAEALAGRARVRKTQGRQAEAVADALVATGIEPEVGTLDDLLPSVPAGEPLRDHPAETSR
jgi:tetratricopeptide (TPR) repeat protein